MMVAHGSVDTRSLACLPPNRRLAAIGNCRSGGQRCCVLRACSYRTQWTAELISQTVTGGCIRADLTCHVEQVAVLRLDNVPRSSSPICRWATFYLDPIDVQPPVLALEDDVVSISQCIVTPDRVWLMEMFQSTRAQVEKDLLRLSLKEFSSKKV
jgi:hypothetical protein